ncbi:hypothetical protein J6590_073974 [Homalodisca vitripennis]|nr:hypothetical protein J6590_073974 [Homalodisca vitripennis]
MTGEKQLISWTSSVRGRKLSRTCQKENSSAKLTKHLIKQNFKLELLLTSTPRLGDLTPLYRKGQTPSKDFQSTNLRLFRLQLHFRAKNADAHEYMLLHINTSLSRQKWETDGNYALSLLYIFENRLFAKATLCDPSRAFDTMYHADLVCIDGEWSQEIEVESGVPQDSVLGLILVIISIIDLPLNARTKILMYANETTFISHCDNIYDPSETGNSVIVNASVASFVCTEMATFTGGERARCVLLFHETNYATTGLLFTVGTRILSRQVVVFVMRNRQVAHSPKKSTRRAAVETGIPQKTVWRMLRIRLLLKPYGLIIVQHITDLEKAARGEFYVVMLDRIGERDGLSHYVVVAITSSACRGMSIVRNKGAIHHPLVFSHVASLDSFGDFIDFRKESSVHITYFVLKISHFKKN